MIGVEKYEYIRQSHRVYGKSIHQIRRETGHSRETIRNALKGEADTYSRRVDQPYPVLGPYRQIIDEWLSGDKEQPKKQRHTARRVYHRLVEEHKFGGSESSVRHYIQEARLRLGVREAKVFIPLDPVCGMEAEVDWGSAIAFIDGIQTPIKYFCMRSRYSGKHIVRAYLCEKQQAFFDAHIHAFNFFGGIFPNLVYDNLTTAVKDVLRGRGRVEQDSFVKFRSYYNFKPRFCNVGQGHEKGGVEGIVGYARRNYMVPIPSVKSIDELNEGLLSKCVCFGDLRITGRDRTVNEFFEEERSDLIRLPEFVFSNLYTQTSKVKSYSIVLVDKNHYSVPTRYVDMRVHINVGIDKVEIFWNNKKIASHQRLFGINKWQIDPQHYLELIKERPGAFQTARPISQWRLSWPKSLEDLLERFQQAQGETKGIKDFINVLMLYRDYPGKDIEAAIELGLEKKLNNSDGVKHILLYLKGDHPIEPLSNWPTIDAADVRAYGQLGGVQ